MACLTLAGTGRERLAGSRGADETIGGAGDIGNSQPRLWARNTCQCRYLVNAEDQQLSSHVFAATHLSQTVFIGH
jgi:hypothetical protein